MKNRLSALAAIAIVSGAMLTGCNMQDKKVETSKDMIQDAKEDVAEANMAMASAIEQFKEESAKLIAANEKSIAEFKRKSAEEKVADRAMLEEKVAELEQKNVALKEKLADYKNDGTKKWDAFKEEFNHDMKELGKAFSDLTVKNTN